MSSPMVNCIHKSKMGMQGISLLTHPLLSFIFLAVSAKSEARYWRIGTKRRNSRHQRGFFVACCPASAFYGSCGKAGEIPSGLPFDRYANLVTTATKSDIGVSFGGSISKGAIPDGYLSSCHFIRQHAPFICLYRTPHQDHQGQQLPGCCDCRPTPQCRCYWMVECGWRVQ